MCIRDRRIAVSLHRNFTSAGYSASPIGKYHYPSDCHCHIGCNPIPVSYTHLDWCALIFGNNITDCGIHFLDGVRRSAANQHIFKGCLLYTSPYGGRAIPAHSSSSKNCSPHGQDCTVSLLNKKTITLTYINHNHLTKSLIVWFKIKHDH